jgi:hypothetical protein
MDGERGGDERARDDRKKTEHSTPTRQARRLLVQCSIVAASPSTSANNNDTAATTMSESGAPPNSGASLATPKICCLSMAWGFFTGGAAPRFVLEGASDGSTSSMEHDDSVARNTLAIWAVGGWVGGWVAGACVNGWVGGVREGRREAAWRSAINNTDNINDTEGHCRRATTTQSDARERAALPAHETGGARTDGHLADQVAGQHEEVRVD